MIYSLYNAPIIRSVYPSAIWQISTDKPEVFITFDDGPHPEITPWVLDVLDKFDAKATFFCIGDNVLKYPKTYQQILDEGHRTGNHTFNHLNGFSTSTPEYMRNIEACAKVLHSTLFRPPYGRLRRAQVKRIKAETSYQIILWSILSVDYVQNLHVEKGIKRIIKFTKPGSIVVFHDSLKAEKNLKKMLPAYLQFLQDNQLISKVIHL